MSRLEKKCLLASTVFHGFLLLLVAFGAAFFLPEGKPPPEMPRLRVVPSILVDSALAGGGGNPSLPRTDDTQKGDTLTPQPPAAVVQPPRPAPQPQRPTPAPPKPPVPKPEVSKAEPKKPDVVKPKKPVKPVEPEKPKPDAKQPPEPTLNDLLTPMVRKSEDKAKAKAEAEAREAAREAVRAEAAYQARVAQAVGKAASNLREGFASGTKVEVGGPGGAAYADYRQFVQAIYQETWEALLPQDILANDTSALVSVTISRGGKVIARRIVRRSGSPSIDRIVQRTLDRVTFVRPFPDAAKDDQREFTIEFNFRNRKLSG